MAPPLPTFNIEIPSHDGQRFGAYLAKSSTKNAPVLIVIQEIFGVNAGMRTMCDAWAQQGYHAICPDLFWRQKPGIDITDKSEAEWQQAFELFNGFDVELGMKDLISTVAVARSLPGANRKVGSIGFCLGGKLAFLMATRSDADCNISYYGVGLMELLGELPAIKHPLLLHFAENDKFTDADSLQTIQTACVKNPLIEQHLYKGIQHAFARVDGGTRDDAAAELANERSAGFLKKCLG